MTSKLTHVRLAPYGALAASAFVLAVLAITLRGHLVVALVIAGLAALFTYWYLYHVDESRRKWIPEDWQWQIEIRHSEVRPKEVDRVRRYFIEDETEILWISHRHVIFLLSRIFLPLFLAVVWLAFTAAIGTVRITLPNSGKVGSKLQHVITAHAGSAHRRTAPQAKIHLPKPGWIHWPHALTIPWWVIILPALLLLLVALLQWAAWSSWFFIVTNCRIIILTRPYSVLPFTNGKDDPFMWAFIKNAEVTGSDFRRRWGLAVIDISTYLQPPEDEALKGLNLAHPDEIAEMVNKLVPEQGSMTEGSREVKELNDSVKELTATIRRLPGLIGSNPPQDEWPTQEM